MNFFEEKDQFIRRLQMEYAIAIGLFSAVIALILIGAAIF
jgi:ABC-type polysaccharide transport system permease subunit